MDQVSQVRERIDIVALLGEYISVKKGGRNFKARCPFHEEKTPSFMISPERQRWHCFGCGKGGDAFTFLMEYEHIEFPEALRILAKRAGVVLQQNSFESKNSEKKERLAEINSFAGQYYHYILTKLPAGKKALEYVTNRGVSEKALESFQIGYAPSAMSGLSDYLTLKKKFTKEEVIDSGLAYERNGRLRDFFYSRLMFPLIDTNGTVVGFSGRVLEDIQSGPKYINTRETLLYHKGEHLFGIHLTKDSIRKEDQAILVEGEFDVLSCFQNGVGNVAAVKGTALTERQVALLGRFASKITMCFDGDKAGQEAIKRSLPIIEKKGLTTSVIVIPGGKDPDEAIKNSPAQFQQAVKHDVGVYDFLLDVMSKRYDPNSIEGKKEVGQELLPIFSGIQNEIVKEHYMKKLSTLLQTSYESLQKELGKLQKERPALHPTPQGTKKSQEETMEEYLLACLVQSDQPLVYLLSLQGFFQDSVPSIRSTQKLLAHLFEFAKTGATEFPDSFSQTLPTELLETYDKAYLYPLSLADKKQEEREILRVGKQLATLYLKTCIQELMQKMTSAEEEKEEGLQKEYIELTNRLKTLSA
jgi:DNA primase